jgi:hypothetical protein
MAKNHGRCIILAGRLTSPWQPPPGMAKLKCDKPGGTVGMVSASTSRVRSALRRPYSSGSVVNSSG